MKTIVLGVGNPILQDDGVGLHVIDALRQRYEQSNGHDRYRIRPGE